MNALPEKTAFDKAQPGFFPIFQQLRFGELHIKQDEASGMLAIIAIHSTKLGPALGGCRYLPYASFEEAIIDAMRLAHGMSYKAAISNVAFGGGKAVLIKNPTATPRKQLFERFAQFVHELGGRYITAEDSGTSIVDMDIVKTITPYVTGYSNQSFIHAEPSPLTALGVRRGIEASVLYQLKRSHLEGIHVAILGVGHVGYQLAKELQAFGVKLTVCDINPSALERVCDEFGAQPIRAEEMVNIDCDVFAPCALSNAINPENVDKLKASIVAGSANNQLASVELSYRLKERGILYAPDFVINAGGLIHVEAQYHLTSEEAAKQKVMAIYETLLQIYEEAEKANLPPLIIAEHLAEKKLLAL